MKGSHQVVLVYEEETSIEEAVFPDDLSCSWGGQLFNVRLTYCRQPYEGYSKSRR